MNIQVPLGLGGIPYFTMYPSGGWLRGAIGGKAHCNSWNKWNEVKHGFYTFDTIQFIPFTQSSTDKTDTYTLVP